jgi:hypothetical protein
MMKFIALIVPLIFLVSCLSDNSNTQSKIKTNRDILKNETTNDTNHQPKKKNTESPRQNGLSKTIIEKCEFDPHDLDYKFRKFINPKKLNRYNPIAKKSDKAFEECEKGSLCHFDILLITHKKKLIAYQQSLGAPDENSHGVDLTCYNSNGKIKSYHIWEELKFEHTKKNGEHAYFGSYSYSVEFKDDLTINKDSIRLVKSDPKVPVSDDYEPPPSILTTNELKGFLGIKE